MAEGLTDRGRPIYGPTPTGQVSPCARQSPLTSAEVERLTGSLTVSTAKLTERTGHRPPETPLEGWRAVAQWFRERPR